MLLRVGKERNQKPETRNQIPKEEEEEEKKKRRRKPHRLNTERPNDYYCLDDVAAFPAGGFLETEILAWMWVVAFVLRHIRIWVFNLIEVT